MTPGTVLVTGGAGFIGSHTCVDLLEHGYDVVVVDDYSNSSPEALNRVRQIAGRSPVVHELDIRDQAALSDVFDQHPIDAVVHFAAKKAVGESVEIPLDYYSVNLAGTISLLQVMLEHGVGRLVFSSSCSIYGETDKIPLTEDDPACPTNPYARSKWMCEQLLGDVARRHRGFSIVALRYFNPVGAHPSGLLGEDPRGVPNNLLPYALQVAVGRRREVRVFGDDYATVDGTGVRDYIHVMDVADGHRVALDHLDDGAGMDVLNLGTGTGTSVLQLVDAVREASEVDIPYSIVERRHGDVTALVADPSRVAREWGWRAERDVAAICRDAWEFQRLNPDGYHQVLTPSAHA